MLTRESFSSPARNALSDDGIRHRLADDPWERAKRIITVSIEPWNLLVGAAKLGTAHTF